MQKANCDKLAEKYPNVVILQLRGKFYNSYGDSAIVLSAVTGYKLIRKSTQRLRCGFPVNSVEKVVSTFKSKHISFMFFDNAATSNTAFFDDNHFLDFLDKNVVIKDEEKQKAEKNVLSSVMKNHSSELEMISFIDCICEGKEPYTGQQTDVLDINDSRTIRMFYRIRDFLKSR